VALLWPGGYYALGLWQHFKAEQMLSDLGQSKTEFEALQNQLKALADARDAAQTRFDNARENRENAQALLEAIYEKRVAQDPLSHRLSALYADLDKHGVYLNRLEWREHRLTLQVHAASSDRITALVDALTGKQLRVEMALIEEQNGRHHSDLRVLF
jgi:Tfp pilus assembly protein PilN